MSFESDDASLDLPPPEGERGGARRAAMLPLLAFVMLIVSLDHHRD